MTNTTKPTPDESQLKAEQERAAALEQALEDAQQQIDVLSALINEAAPPEAGFSMNFHMSHERAGDMGFTFRGARASNALDVWADAEAFIKHIMEKGWKFNVPQPAPPPVQHKAAEIATQEGNPALAKQIKADYEKIPPPPEGKEWETIEVSRVVIKPQPGETCDIEFWKPGRKYAEIRCTKWKNDRAAGLLKHVTSHDVGKPADLALNCVVYWTKGREYQKQDGTKAHYQDVGHVRPQSD